MTKPKRDIRPLAVSVALVAIVAAIYAQCLHHPFIRLDDPDYVIENDHVNSGLSLANVAWAFTAMYASNWHPLTWISHMLDVQLFGLDAGKHIIVNVIVHAVNSVLLFAFLRRATQTLWPSAAVAALFAVHPLHVESVAWVSERKDVLSTLFFLITLILWTAWVQTGARSRYWWSAAALAAGLMCKPMLVTTPFVLLLLDFWPFRRKVSVIEKWPFFALAIASSLITLRAQRPAMGAAAFASRLANAVVSYVTYIGKTIWPAQLSIVYPFRTAIATSAIVLATIFLVAVCVVAIVFRRRLPFVTIGLFWYLGTLVPVSGIVHVGHEAMADRYTYIPLIGIFIAMVWLCAGNRWLVAAEGVAIAALSVCTWIQIGYWQNGVKLFEHAFAVAGDDRYVREGLGTELLNTHEYRRAETEFRAALAQAPHDDGLHAGLGTALMQLGDIAAARREFEIAIAANRDNATALRRLGDLAMADGRTDQAIDFYSRSVAAKRDPSTLAVLAALQGKTDYAVSLYRQAIAREPNKPEIRGDLAAVLSRSGREVEAVPEYEQALRLDPHQYEVLMNFGALLIRLGRPEDAIAKFKQAGSERLESPEPHIYLALVYARANRNEDALHEASTAYQISPTSANVEFTNALHMPPSDSNLTGWINYLRSKSGGAQGRN
ncbi:MAG TPA: tetratricopeptide repeat protein [Thermoanaerobaculia bacterium]|nr:tetratricopeptide repeat protein [Thermoanaerobaculia bacterium]